MSDVQLEHGYTKIANELLEALCEYCTNPSFLRISLLIIRLTYGWSRKEVVSNTKSFASMLNLTEEYVRSILIEMEFNKMIDLDFHNDHRKFKVNIKKDYEKWSFVRK